MKFLHTRITPAEVACGPISTPISQAVGKAAAGAVAAAEAARRSVRDTADLNDTCGVEIPVPGAAARPMVVIKAAKLERARCGWAHPRPSPLGGGKSEIRLNTALFCGSGNDT